MRKKIGKIKNKTEERRARRKLSIRKTISGTAERPRISPFKSNKNLFVQVIDDNSQKTLFSIQTFGKKSTADLSLNLEGAKQVAVQVAEGLKKRGIENAVFDRNGYKYTGILKTLGDVIRENGIRI